MTVANRHIDLIQTGEQPGGLLSVARPLPDGSDWKGGITFTPSCIDSIGTWACATAGEKEPSVKGDPVRFDPFLIYSAAKCDGAPVIDDLRELVRGKLERESGSELARNLVIKNDDVEDGLGFTDAATDITPGAGTTSLKNSLAGLLSHSAGCGEIVLHAPRVALPYLLDIGLEVRDGRYWYGMVPVSVDDYPPLGGVDTDPNEAWLYLSGPIEYEMAPIGEAEFNHYTGRLNEALLVGERLAVLRFDPCCVYAIRALLCGAGSGEVPVIEEVVVTP